uniref:HIT domain-containing protein n=1 Tax=Entomoneis paludosa TaxID=265537 RepID=A0A7S2YT32_9STRA|mmetsp:Transcript_8626/g.17929  ORF Transcript_8626/g.17929 Transcript_8626/m.17929 type:complete len:185 (+) Transcript_8626:160-714(+)
MRSHRLAFLSFSLSSLHRVGVTRAASFVIQNQSHYSFVHSRKSPFHTPAIRAMSDEVAKAQTASGGSGDGGEPTVFDKILSGEWDSTKVYDDDRVYAFKDISPQAPTHVILIPKVRDGLTQLCKARVDQEGILGHLLFVAAQIGKEHCPEGYRIVINDGKEGAQTVYHLHVHILGGRQMNWPPG